jgi:hypothetical protein
MIGGRTLSPYNALLGIPITMKSFYEILEVPESASTEQIRSAYLRMAREYHPDRVPEHLTKLRADAEAKFKQVQEAWAVLSDPAKRRRYDLRTYPQFAPGTAPATPNGRPTGAGGRIRDLLGHKQDLAKWALIVLITTLLLVVLGEVVVSRETAVAPVSNPADQAKVRTEVGSPGVREYKLQPHHIQTWRAEGGKGLEIELISVISRRDELEISFRIQAGAHGDLLLYEPPGAPGRTRNILGKKVVVDRDFAEIYIQDNAGAKYISTTGLVGGQQANFNLYNFTGRINFRPNEDVVLSARFPPVNRNASSITFVSPAIGKWQPEWRWPAINLK